MNSRWGRLIQLKLGRSDLSGPHADRMGRPVRIQFSVVLPLALVTLPLVPLAFSLTFPVSLAVPVALLLLALPSGAGVGFPGANGRLLLIRDANKAPADTGGEA